MFRRFNISLVFRAARSKRSAKPIISTYCPSRKIRFQGLSKSWSKKKKKLGWKNFDRDSRSSREEKSRKETKVNGERERENRKGMILDTTTRQIFATSSRASIIPRRSTRYQRSLIDLSPRKKREREEEHRWWNFWNQLPGSEMAR